MTTSLDLPGILAQHAGYHARLSDGEFDGAPEGTFDELLGNEQMRPIIQAIGVKGVGDLLHVAHELAIQVLKDDALKDALQEFTFDEPKEAPEPDPEVDYVRHVIEGVANWYMMATMMGLA
jgi:hypothetical protein